MSVIKDVEGFVLSKIETVKTLFSLLSLEATLARLSVYPLLINLCMLFVVLITLWSSLMIFIAYMAVLKLNNPLIAIALVIVLNLSLLLGLLRCLSTNLANMSFEKTREYFAKTESNPHDTLEKKTSSSESGSDEHTPLPASTSDAL